MNKDKSNTIIDFEFNNIRHKIDALKVINIGYTYEKHESHGTEPIYEFIVNIETDDGFEDEQRLFSGSNLYELTKIKEKIKSAKVYVDSDDHIRINKDKSKFKEYSIEEDSYLVDLVEVVSLFIETAPETGYPKVCVLFKNSRTLEIPNPDKDYLTKLYEELKNDLINGI